MEIDFSKVLSGGDLRSIGASISVALHICNQQDFDTLFKYIFHPDRIVTMRAVDAIEKISFSQPEFLQKHKKRIFELLGRAKDKELKWHIAQLVPRLQLTNREFGLAWVTLTDWAKDRSNSRIVRVHSIQALADMAWQQTFTILWKILKKKIFPPCRPGSEKLESIFLKHVDSIHCVFLFDYSFKGSKCFTWYPTQSGFFQFRS